MGAADGDYGDLAEQVSPPRTGRWLTGGLAAIAIVAVVGYLALGQGTDPPNETGASTPESTGTTTASTTTEPSSTTGDIADSPGWTVAEGDLPAYITEPVFYEPGTTEAEIEVAYVNAEIASLRALAEPTITEPEVEKWQTGFALVATEDSRQILLEDGQVIRAGPLTRIEIEDVSVLSDTEADVEACFLTHSISIVVDDPSDQLETIRTLHGTQRMVRSPDGHWQLSELLTVIQDVDGFGACLDVTLSPVDPGETPESNTELEESLS